MGSAEGELESCDARIDVHVSRIEPHRSHSEDNRDASIHRAIAYVFVKVAY